MSNTKMLVLIVVLVVLIVIGPWIVIWAWNTLFGAHVAVAYSIETWFAVMVLLGAIHSPVSVRKK
jgi:hypothetical protein